MIEIEKYITRIIEDTYYLKNVPEVIKNKIIRKHQFRSKVGLYHKEFYLHDIKNDVIIIKELNYKKMTSATLYNHILKNHDLSTRERNNIKWRLSQGESVEVDGIIYTPKKTGEKNETK